ncbi:MAG: hypothetical protein NWR72_16500 [Bacteroidia bacterium]|nr:hypothetical protein [Bacteroidia bacterium]
MFDTLIDLLFIGAAGFSVWQLYRASARPLWLLLGFLAWAALQAWLGHSEFYAVDGAMPPRFVWMPGPPLLAIFLLFALPAGRAWMDKWNLQALTWVHVVRVPVEFVLWYLYVKGRIPELMSVEGGNLDILAGLSAPVMVQLSFYADRRIGRSWLFLWNILCLGLLLNIVVRGILSAPSPFQQFGQEVEHFALIDFPYTWLPSVIVPIVMLSHLAAMRAIWLQNPRSVS